LSTQQNKEEKTELKDFDKPVLSFIIFFFYIILSLLLAIIIRSPIDYIIGLISNLTGKTLFSISYLDCVGLLWLILWLKIKFD